MALTDWIPRIRWGRSKEASGNSAVVAEPPNLDNLIAQAKRDGAAEAVQEMARALTNQVLPPLPSPTERPPYGAYAFNNPITYSTPQPPYRRPQSLVTNDTLRILAGTYDILRSCINHLKREVRTVPFRVVPRDAKDDSEVTLKRCAAAMMLFQRRGPVGGIGQQYQHFESAILEDVLVIGAGAIYHERSRGGQWLSCTEVDAATIRPWVDAYGWPPADTGPYSDQVYEQWIYGVHVAKFSRQDLTYDGVWPVSYSPYFMSPVEWLVMTVNSALRADNWNQTWLTDGSTPDEMVALPQEWEASQVIQWQQFWDAMLAGNSANRHKTKFVPGGSQRVGNPTRKDQDFQQFELWLLKRTCSIMGVQPASIGFVGDQYKVTQDESMQATTQFGAGDLLTFRKAQLDDILDRAGYSDLEVVNVTERERSEKETADTGKTLIESGQRTPNEVRKAQGLPPVPDGDVLLVSSTLTTLERTINPPEPPPMPGPGGTDEDEDDDPPPADDPKKRVQRAKKKTLTQAVDEHRANLLQHEETATAATIAAWEEAESGIRERLDAVRERIQSAQDAGEPVSEGWLRAEERFRALLGEITARVADLAEAGGAAVTAGQSAAVGASLSALPVMAGLAAGDAPRGVSLAWNALPTNAVEALVGFASDGSPLRDLFNAIGPDLAESATSALIEGLTAGDNPKVTARRLESALNVSRARAVNIARTETLRAAREAANQSFIANADVVTGWVWLCSLGTRTCAGCWAKHGTIYGPHERMHEHCQGRCTQAPVTHSWGEILGDETIPDTRPTFETGETLFSRLSAEDRKTILGADLAALYEAGTVRLADAVTTESDPGGRWPPQIRPATVAEAVASAGATMRADLAKWERKALSRLKEGKQAACPFDSDYISREIWARVKMGLESATTPDEVKAVFRGTYENED